MGWLRLWRQRCKGIGLCVSAAIDFESMEPVRGLNYLGSRVMLLAVSNDDSIVVKEFRAPAHCAGDVFLGITPQLDPFQAGLEVAQGVAI